MKDKEDIVADLFVGIVTLVVFVFLLAAIL
jgi:hypothetical protein